MFVFDLLKTLILGIVEGFTEWLPVSSTGHMILLDEFLKLDVSERFMDLFLIVIQLGAICAVPVLFWQKINPFSRKKSQSERRATWRLWSRVIVGAIPAGVIGLLIEVIFDDAFENALYNYLVVSIALIAYGVLFIVIEKINKKKKYRVEAPEDLSYADALKIGAFQVLSLIPGTSRSGSTMIGGIATGVSRTASSEFSFFMAIPLMLGASGLKAVKFVLDGISLSWQESVILAVGVVVSFLVSLFAIRFLMDFVKRNDFKPFGIYRIVLGIIVIGYFVIKSFT